MLILVEKNGKVFSSRIDDATVVCNRNVILKASQEQSALPFVGRVRKWFAEIRSSSQSPKTLRLSVEKDGIKSIVLSN